MKYSRPLKQFYDPKEKYLFLGNGINLLSKGHNWGDLLKEVANRVSITVDFNGKSYPLLFEEIAFKIRPNSHVEHNINYLKKLIGETCHHYEPNEYHQKVIEAKYYDHFLTTNYDYSIERSLSSSFDSCKNKNQKNRKYSLHRYNIVDNKKVWHIHGEIDNGLRGNVYQKEESVLIGNEHYSDYLRKIHELVKGDTGIGLYKLIRDGKENWIHLFFTRDIDILGFGFNFSETHLWFIINFRARLIRKGASIPNKIRWIVPSFDMKKNKGIIDLLNILGIKVRSIESPISDYKLFYDKFISELR